MVMVFRSPIFTVVTIRETYHLKMSLQPYKLFQSGDIVMMNMFFLPINLVDLIEPINV